MSILCAENQHVEHLFTHNHCCRILIFYPRLFLLFDRPGLFPVTNVLLILNQVQPLSLWGNSFIIWEKAYSFFTVDRVKTFI